MSKKIKVLLTILIIIFITIIYNYVFRSKVEYEKNNTPSERQYRKNNTDKLLKSSSYKEFYVDIYKENEFTLVVDDYSPIRIDHEPFNITLSTINNIKSDDIDLIWEDINNQEVRLTININNNGELQWRTIIDYS